MKAGQVSYRIAYILYFPDFISVMKICSSIPHISCKLQVGLKGLIVVSFKVFNKNTL